MIAYFAYGSNMCLSRIRQRIPAAHPIGVAVLSGHVLRWHKKSNDGSGKCDAFATDVPADRVIGVVFEIPEADKALLDRVEGLDAGYDEKAAQVLLADGESKEAVFYVAASSAIDASQIPYDWYKEHVERGARDFELPEAYRERIAATPSKPDPDTARAAKQRAIRAGSSSRAPSVKQPVGCRASLTGSSPQSLAPCAIRAKG